VRTATIIYRFHFSYEDHQIANNLYDSREKLQDSIISVIYLLEKKYNDILRVRVDEGNSIN
jgi:hypothetical protein